MIALPSDSPRGDFGDSPPQKATFHGIGRQRERALVAGQGFGVAGQPPEQIGARRMIKLFQMALEQFGREKTLNARRR